MIATARILMPASRGAPVGGAHWRCRARRSCSASWPARTRSSTARSCSPPATRTSTPTRRCCATRGCARRPWPRAGAPRDRTPLPRDWTPCDIGEARSPGSSPGGARRRATSRRSSGSSSSTSGAVVGLILAPLPGWPVLLRRAASCTSWAASAPPSATTARIAHKSVKLHPVVRNVLTFFAMLNGSGSPLSWAAYHRLHHAKSDTPEDISSPRVGGFWWSHLRWLWQAGAAPITKYCKDIDTPELPGVDARADPAGIAVGSCAGLPFGLAAFFWLGPIRLTLALHAQCFVNSICHMRPDAAPTRRRRRTSAGWRSCTSSRARTGTRTTTTAPARRASAGSRRSSTSAGTRSCSSRSWASPPTSAGRHGREQSLDAAGLSAARSRSRPAPLAARFVDARARRRSTGSASGAPDRASGSRPCARRGGRGSARPGRRSRARRSAPPAARTRRPGSAAPPGR